jgi:septal ring factor EnvC (AmiA/AmiB activator)
MLLFRPLRLILPMLALPMLALIAVGAADAQQAQSYDSVDETVRALTAARAQSAAAKRRGDQLEAEAARVTQAADKTAHEAATIAARIQQSEAEIAAHEARITLINRQRIALRARLAEKQRPVVRLTAALQLMSRRPPALSLLHPGSVRDTMYMRAILGTILPQIRQSTASLRAEIDRGRVLQQAAQGAAQSLRASEGELGARRQSLAALETRQRLASRAAMGTADREAERALALAEQARDLSGLVDDLGRAGALREQLARLPGPVLRPDRPSESQVVSIEGPSEQATAEQATGLPGYMLPVDGRLTAGFGDASPNAPKSRGITLAPRPGAQTVAPAAGRVVFAGPYQGYGSIVIIDHGGGWTSLITGLAQLDTSVGASLVAGSPLGIAGPGRSLINVELRRDGVPVNPLEMVRGR